MAKSKTTARKRKNGGKVGKALLFFGMLAGAAIGAAVALVYSPSKGEENREHLVAYISDKAGLQ